MRTIDDQLRDLARIADESLPWIDPTDVMETSRITVLPRPVAVKPPASRGRRPGWVTATATAVAVLVVLGGAALVFRDAQSDSPPSEEVTSTTVTGSVHYDMDWAFVPRSTGLPLYSLNSSTTQNLISTPTGLLMPDTVSNEMVDPLMLRSVDGTVWTSEPTPDGIRPEVMRQFDETFLIEGRYGRVFTSTDGSTWVEEPGDNFPDLGWIQYLGFDVHSLQQIEAPWPLVAGRDVVAMINGRYVAYKPPDNADDWRVATSDNGTTWTPVDQHGLNGLTTKTYSEFGFFDLRDGVLIFSGHQLNDDDTSQTRLMRSRDGLTWMDVTPTDFARAPGIRASDSGWIAGGGWSGDEVSTGDGAQMVSSRLYFSEDGTTWAELVIHDDPLTGPSFQLAIAGDTIIRWGGTDTVRGDYQVASLTSRASHRPIPAVPPPATQEITVTWTNGQNDPGRGPWFRTIVGTSSGFLGTDRSGTLWHSPDGTSWEPTLTGLKGVSVASSGSMTLVSGVRGGRAVLLRSVDGVEWSEVDRSEVPEQVRVLIATTPNGLTWFGAAYGSSEGVLAVVEVDRVTTVHEPPWDEYECCGTTTLLQVGDNVAAYQYDRNSPQFSHAWEYLGNRQWSDTFDVPLSIEHAVVGDTMLKFDHTHATCCGNPISGESLWPLLSSNDGIAWTEVGQITGHDVHSLHVNAGLSFWIYGPQIGGGGNDIEVVPGTTLWLSTDGRNWQQTDIPQGIDERFQHGPTGFVHVAGETIFISYNSEDELADQYWVGTVETN